MTRPTREATHPRLIMTVGALRAFRSVVFYQAVVAAGRHAQAVAEHNAAVEHMAALHAVDAAAIHAVMIDPDECIFCDREEQNA